jgi:hypothetical protein
MSLLHDLITAALAAAVVAATPFQAAAQSTAPTLGSLRTPPSPAFTVLGIEPSAVERPMTPSDVALSFINKIRQGTIPRDYAVEASPYWLVSQPNLSWQNDVTRNLGESVARTLSLSIATADTGTAALPTTSMAVGVRTLLSSGHMTAATQRALTALEQTLSETGDLFLRMVGEAGLDALDKRLASGDIAPADYEIRKQELTALVLESDAYREAMARAEDVAAKREGFFFEVAAGLVWDFPGASWESRAFRRRGAPALRRVPDHRGRLLPGRDGRQDADRDRRARGAVPVARHGGARHHARHAHRERARGARRRRADPPRTDEDGAHDRGARVRAARPVGALRGLNAA